MGHPLNLKALIPNGTMTVVFLRGRNVRSLGLIGVGPVNEKKNFMRIHQGTLYLSF
jgi:hypothetical protein